MYFNVLAAKLHKRSRKIRVVIVKKFDFRDEYARNQAAWTK
jgi:hypothetical protein